MLSLKGVDGNSGNVDYNAEVLKFGVGVLPFFNVRGGQQNQ